MIFNYTYTALIKLKLILKRTMEINWRVFRQEGDMTWLTAHSATMTAKWKLDCKRGRGEMGDQ